jgi:cytochrome c peroxidase
LYWDMQVGSDGIQACASCHFHAGADNRAKNQLNPDTLGGDATFGNSAIPGIPSVEGHLQFAPNYEVIASDFPFHDRDPETAAVPRGTGVTPTQEFFTVTKDTNDVMSSQGVRLKKFLGVTPGKAEDLGITVKDPVFKVKNINLRRVEPRNTPTNINAVFNLDVFWEGRASTIFNGVNPFGFRDRTSTLKKNVNGTLTDVKVRIPFSALASQAVGPPVSDFEMSYQGRDFPSIGRKMLSLQPLAKQLVHPEDSVLGALANGTLVGNTVTGKKGLKVKNYAEMVKAAFKDEWWNSTEILTIVDGTQFVHQPERQNPRIFVVNLGQAVVSKARPGVDLGPKQFTQMQYNFSLFFGLALQLYQATLVADDTPWDRFVGSNINYPGGGTPANPKPIAPDPNALTAQEQQGLILFGRGTGGLGCQVCHALPETTEHTISSLRPDSNGVPQIAAGVTRFVQVLNEGNGGGPGPSAYFDFGMRNIGHRPTQEDIGRNGTAPDLPPFRNPLDGNKPLPLSYTELAKLKAATPAKLPAEVAFYVPDLSTARLVGGSPPPVDERSVTKGNFKVPTLRNGMLTGPYFHDGGYTTLRQVVQFYSRGGNFPNTNYNELAAGIIPLSDIDPSDPLKSDAEKAAAEANIQALVAFLANGLTDQRVVYQKAPFDHPQLFVPNGAPDKTPVLDRFIEIPPVGKSGVVTPLSTFLDLDPQTP